MHLTKEQSDMVEEMAYRLIEPSLIAINIEADEMQFIEELGIPGSEVRQAFYKGYVRQLVETREAVIKSARNGSNPSLEMMIQFFKQLKNYL